MSEGGMFLKIKHGTILLVLLQVIIGLYFLNFPFSFVTIPAYISKFNDWIVFLGGILILFGTINYFRAKKKH